MGVNQKQQQAHLDGEIRKIERELEALRIRLDTLREMRGVFYTSRKSSAVNEENAVESPNGLLGPGKAIRGLLSDRPGMDQEAIIKELKGKIRTKSANQDRLIRNTVLNMVRDGLLRKDENGGFFLK